MKKYLLPIISLFSLVSLLGFSRPGSQELRINNIYGNNLDYSITGNFIVLNIASPSNYTSYVLTVYPSVTAGVEITLSSGEVLYQGGNPKRVVYDYSSNPDIILTHTESGVNRRYKTLFTNFTNPTLGTANEIIEPRVNSFNLYTSSLSGSVGNCQVKNLNIFCKYQYTTAIGGNLALAANVNDIVSTITSTDFNIIRNGSSSQYYTPTTVNVNMPKTFTVTGTNGVSRKYNLYVDTIVSDPKSSAKKIIQIYDDTYNNMSEVIQDQSNLYMRISTNGISVREIYHSNYLGLTINGIALSTINAYFGYSQPISGSPIAIASGMNYPVIAKAEDGSIANYTLYVLAPLGTIVSDMTYNADFNGLDFEYDRKKVGNTYFIGVDSSTYETLSDYSARIYSSNLAKVYVDGELFTRQNLDWTQPHSVTIKSFDNKKENTFTIKVMQISTTSAQDNGVPFVPIVEVDKDLPIVNGAYISSNPLDNGYYYAVQNGNEFKIEVPRNYNLENLYLDVYGNYNVQIGELASGGGRFNLANPITLYAYNNQGLRKEYTLVVEKTLPPIPAYMPSTSTGFANDYIVYNGNFLYNFDKYSWAGNRGFTVSGNNILLPELANITDISNVSIYFYQVGSFVNSFSIPGKAFNAGETIRLDLTTPKVVKVFAEAGNVAYYTITGFVPPLSSVVGINYFRNFAFHKVMQDVDNPAITHLFLNEGYSVSNAPIYYGLFGKNAKIKFNGEFIPTNNSSYRAFNATSPIVFTLIAENGSTVTSRVIVHPYDEADLDPVSPPSLSSDARVSRLSITNTTVYYYNQPSNSNGYFANDVIYIRLDKNYTSKRFAADFDFFSNSNDVTVYVNDVLQFNGSSVQDFTEPVTFKIVAQNGTTKYYTVVVAEQGVPFKLIANTLTGVSETLTKQTSAEVVLYPNPIAGGDELSVSTGLAVANAIEIYSLVGSLQKSIKPISNVSTINTYGLAKGVYLAKIKWADLSSKTIRFVID
ncbi:MAG: T9SS C-terminal target domain-containing protein [Bacteroidetes bacterium]|nr:MAG: T9SS C-terminal target domain-containing protein [Bacteroidota bacterium]